MVWARPNSLRDRPPVRYHPAGRANGLTRKRRLALFVMVAQFRTPQGVTLDGLVDLLDSQHSVHSLHESGRQSLRLVSVGGASCAALPDTRKVEREDAPFATS